MNTAICRLAALSLALAGIVMTPMNLAAAAGEDVHRRHVVTVVTGPNERVEADVSHLEVGESEVFLTDSGTAIDLVRTRDGMEIYIDGELLEVAPDEAAIARLHRDAEAIHISEEVEVECFSSDDSACKHVQVINAGEEAVVNAAIAGEYEVRVMLIERRSSETD